MGPWAIEHLEPLALVARGRIDDGDPSRRVCFVLRYINYIIMHFLYSILEMLILLRIKI